MAGEYGHQVWTIAMCDEQPIRTCNTRNFSQILENKYGMYFASFALLPAKPCQTGTLVKRLLLMLINVGVLRTGCIILPPAPSVLQEGSSDASDAGVKTRGSVRRISGLVQTPW